MKKGILTSLLLYFTFASLCQSEYPLETVLQKGHSDYVRAYSFSPDSRFIITGGFDNVLLLWDVQSGKQIRTFSGHTERIRSIEFSPNQQHVFSVSADNTAKIFEVETGKVLHSFSVPNREFYKGFFSPGGSYVYVLDNRDEVFVWNASTGEEVGEFEKEYSAHNERFLINPSEDKILSAGGYKGGYVMSLITQDTLLFVPFDKVHSMSFSTDGEYFALSSRKLFAQVYKTETGELVNEFRDGDEKCDGCNTKHVLSPDGKYLVTMSNMVGAILWDVKSGKKIRTFLEIDERPNQLKFSANGKYLMVSLDDDAFVYDTQSGTQKIHLESDKIEYLDLKFSQDEGYLAAPNDNGGIDLWDIARGRVKKTIRGYLNTTNNNGFNLSYSNWGDQSILNYIQHKRKVLISPDGRHVMIGSVDTSALLINMFTGRVEKIFRGHSKAVIAFDFSPDGKFVATAGGDRKVKVWDMETGEVVKELRGHQETIFDLKFDANGEYIVSGAWDGTMRIWQWRTGKSEYIELRKNSPYCVGFTPNQLYIVTGDLDHSFQFWERDAAEPFRALVGHTSIPSGFDFSPDAKHMATASWDGNVKLWDVLTGMLIGKLTDHAGHVYAVKYDPKGRFIASGGSDNRVVLWDPVSNEIVKELKGHATAITSIDISKDGKYLISMSVDGLMKVWDLATFQEVYSRIQMASDQWLATNPYGYFDGSSNALDWVNYVKGNQVVNVSNLFEKYYTPNLIERINNNEQGLDDRSELLKGGLSNLPELSLAIGTGNKRSLILNADSVFTSKEETIPLEVVVNKHDSDLDEIRIYNNGKLIINESLERNISFRGASDTYLFDVPLSNGINTLKAIAVDAKRTESQPTTVLVDYNGETAQTDLFILSIGINNYKNPSYNLDYAVNDSKAFVKTIKKGADSLFNNVVTYSILNSEATKTNIMNTLLEINQSIGSEDVFLFYYAGHGVMSNEDNPDDAEFFIVTHDVTNLYDSPQVIREKAISATEIMEISIGVAAEKQLFILDACHSGGAIESFAVRGSEREKALAQLARNTGTFFLTAAQDAQYANEVGKLNHGLFTYALLEILQGEMADADQKITVSELKSYVEERVPELTQQYHGSPQYPTGYSFGRDFPIVILK